MRKIIPASILLVVGGFGAFILFNNSPSTSFPKMSKSTTSLLTFGEQKKSAHFETSTPEHGSTLADLPVNIVIDFNFDLSPKSTMSVIKEGKEYATGTTSIDQNNLSMRRQMSVNSSDGLYNVNYNACWPDGSCHDGSFQFAIDRIKAESYDDMRNKREVMVRMSELMFKPKDVRISSGTKVTWINDDNVSHYVNTDSHPAHTYYLAQNSKALMKGDSYTVAFDLPGIYPYHCSAHADSMMGMILVE